MHNSRLRNEPPRIDMSLHIREGTHLTKTSLSKVTYEQVPPRTQPFIKWAGGKRWLAGTLAVLFQDVYGRYIEPFVGSGACFFSSGASRNAAILSDTNAELIATYVAVRDYSEPLIRRLSSLEINRTTFETIRQMRPWTHVGRGTRFIYLNKTAFNGLYRVNRHGKFNVPFGCKSTTKLCDPDLIRACSKRLAAAELLTCDFEDALANTQLDDLVYLDPPYTVKHNTNNFRRYNKRIFSWNDQIRLASQAIMLAKRGVRVLITNALHRHVMDLYPKTVFASFSLTRPTNMAASIENRGSCEELLLVSSSFGYTTRRLKSLLSCASSDRAPRIIKGVPD